MTSFEYKQIQEFTMQIFLIDTLHSLSNLLLIKIKIKKFYGLEIPVMTYFFVVTKS